MSVKLLVICPQRAQRSGAKQSQASAIASLPTLREGVPPTQLTCIRPDNIHSSNFLLIV